MPKMLRNPRVALFALVVVCVAVASSVGLTRAQPVEKNQKVRPYQFGFTIDEQQHRFEKQDERGIVMGEFGFITADGIYHVTVYATDEEGKFRILAMKSYPYESPPKAIDMVVKPKAEPLPTTRTTTPLPKFHGNAKACSGCFIPKEGAKSVQSTSPKTAIRTLSKSLPAENGSKGRLPGFINPSFSNTAKTQTTNKALPTSTESAGAAPKTALVNAQRAATASSGGTQQITMQNSKSGNGSGKFGGNDSENNRGGGSTNNNGRGPSGSGNIGGQPGSKPTSSATDAGDLYRFKYLLDYNGHTETGARNGNKQGSFFAIGDDNVQRTVEYIANEFGFQPRISWRKLDSGTKLPLENSLKDYEFVWFRKDE